MAQMALLPLALLAGGAGVIWYVSQKKQEAPAGPISTYTLSNGSTVDVPFNNIISLPDSGPAEPQNFPSGLWERWMAFANAPQSFTAENALALEYDLAAAGAWYEAAYLSQANMA